MPKDFGQRCIKVFNIAKNLIGKGKKRKISKQLVQNQDLETLSYLKMLPKCHNLSFMAVTGHEISFVLL